MGEERMGNGAGVEDKVREVADLLEEEYGRPAPRRRLRPLDELVLTILSQHTSDANSDRAFERLKEKLPTWEAVREAPVEEIAEAIRPGGLATMKAPRIKELLLRLGSERGDLDMDFLREMDMEEARTYLLGIDGVGPKTAACVLLFSCDRPAFPVDTHIHRVSTRLGILEAGTSADEAHRILEQMVPPERVYSFHVNLITHGRRVCKAQRPLCDQCVLAPLCDFFAGKSAASGKMDRRSA